MIVSRIACHKSGAGCCGSLIILLESLKMTENRVFYEADEGAGKYFEK